MYKSKYREVHAKELQIIGTLNFIPCFLMLLIFFFNVESENKSFQATSKVHFSVYTRASILTNST
jgi:hypothetical protein